MHATVVLTAGLALVQGISSSSSNTGVLATPTIQTNSLGAATGVVTATTTVVPSAATSVNGTIVLPTSVANSTVTAAVNGTGITSGASGTGLGAAATSAGSDNTGGAAMMMPALGLGAAGAIFAFFF